jgi:exodeoxyribonuclease VII small subunit
VAGKKKSDDIVEQIDVSQNFEQAIAELEKIVSAMEQGDMSLEGSLAAYQRGVLLAKACQSHLLAAEQQVKVLEDDLLRPFEPGDQEPPA